MGCKKIDFQNYYEPDFFIVKNDLKSEKSKKKVYTEHRYSFNSQESEHQELSDILSAEFWFYDAAIGRRWNIDPVTFPNISPYATFMCNPIYYSDPTGLASMEPPGDSPEAESDQGSNSVGGLGAKNAPDYIWGLSTKPYKHDPDWGKLPSSYGAFQNFIISENGQKNTVKGLVESELDKIKLKDLPSSTSDEIITAMIAEGYGVFLEGSDNAEEYPNLLVPRVDITPNGFEINDDADIVGGDDLGMDNYLIDKIEMERKGYNTTETEKVRRTYEDVKTTDGVVVPKEEKDVPNFGSQSSAIRAFTNYYSFKQSKVLDAGASMGYGSPSADEKIFWTAMYFRSPADAESMLQKNGSWSIAKMVNTHIIKAGFTSEYNTPHPGNYRGKGITKEQRAFALVAKSLKRLITTKTK